MASKIVERQALTMLAIRLVAILVFCSVVGFLIAEFIVHFCSRSGVARSVSDQNVLSSSFMTAAQIRERILDQSDDALLATLPTTTRMACQTCGSVSVSKRSHSAATKTYYCPICKGDKPVHNVTYYLKNKTTDPVTALARHRLFWQRIYFEQLNRESTPSTFLTATASIIIV